MLIEKVTDNGEHWLIEFDGRYAYAQRKGPESASLPRLTEQEQIIVGLCESWNTRTPTASAEGWLPIETAPRDRVLLLINAAGVVYSGRVRYGNLGEPHQDCFEWRAECCGRFGGATHWMPLPQAPEVREGTPHES